MKISVCTAYRWMCFVGMKQGKQTKNTYLDGHMRSDVQEYLKDHFLPQLMKYSSRIRLFHSDDDGETFDQKLERTGEDEIVLVSQDECYCFLYDAGEWGTTNGRFPEKEGYGRKDVGKVL